MFYYDHASFPSCTGHNQFNIYSGGWIVDKKKKLQEHPPVKPLQIPASLSFFASVPKWWTSLVNKRLQAVFLKLFSLVVYMAV